MKPETVEPAPRPNADYRWTLPKAMAFLEALAECGKVAEAARRVGMSARSAFRLRKRLAGTHLEQGWELALRAGTVARHRRRARNGRWDDGGLALLIAVTQGRGLAGQGRGSGEEGRGSGEQGRGSAPEPCQTRQPPALRSPARANYSPPPMPAAEPASE